MTTLYRQPMQIVLPFTPHLWEMLCPVCCEKLQSGCCEHACFEGAIQSHDQWGALYDAAHPEEA